MPPFSARYLANMMRQMQALSGCLWQVPRQMIVSGKCCQSQADVGMSLTATYTCDNENADSPWQLPALYCQHLPEIVGSLRRMMPDARECRRLPLFVRIIDT